MNDDDQYLADLVDFAIAQAEQHGCKPEEVLIDVTSKGFEFAGIEREQ